MPITHKFKVYPLIREGNGEDYDTEPRFGGKGVDCLVSPAGIDILASYPSIPSFQLYEIHTQENYVMKNGDKLVTDSEEFIIKDVPMRVENGYMAYTRIVGQKVV